MRIIEHGYDQLEIRARTWVFWLMLGLGFLISGLVVFFSLGQSTTLACIRSDSSTPICRMSKTLLGRDLSDEPLEALRGAYVASSTDSDGDTTYRVVLQTATGEMPLTNVWSSGYETKRENASKIMAFLNNPNAQELNVTQSGSVGLIVGGVFAGIGLLLLFAFTQTMFNAWYFDRTSMTLTHHRENILNKGDLTWGLNEIAEAVVRSHYDSDGGRTYRVELVTTMNEHIPLTSWYSSGLSRKEAAAQRINQFIQGI